MAKTLPTPAWLQRNGFMQTPDGVWRHFVNGYMHSLTGPAAYYPNGRVAYYINGKRLTKRAFAEQLLSNAKKRGKK